MSKPPQDGQITEHGRVEVTRVHGDLSQEVVRITVDRLKLIIHQHADSIEQRRSWVAPLSMLITLIVVLVTSEFKSVVWQAATWAAIFVIAALLTVIWLVGAVLKRRRSGTIEDLVEKIKKQK